MLHQDMLILVNKIIKFLSARAKSKEYDMTSNKTIKIYPSGGSSKTSTPSYSKVASSKLLMANLENS